MIDSSLIKYIKKYNNSRAMDTIVIHCSATKENKDYTRLIYNIVSIYSSISTKDSTIPSFLNYISTILRQRSALKSYVNNAFASIPSIYERERYSINFDKNLKVYYLEADTSLISISESDREVCGIRDSQLWSDMII
mgnify:CR=1 FL=1